MLGPHRFWCTISFACFCKNTKIQNRQGKKKGTVAVCWWIGMEAGIWGLDVDSGFKLW